MNFAVGCEKSPTKLQHDRSSSICCHWDSYDGNTPFVLVQVETKDRQPVKRSAVPFFGSLGLGLSCSSRLHAVRLLGEGLHLLIVVRGFALKNMEILLLLFFPQGKYDLPLVWLSFSFWNYDEYGVDDHNVHDDDDYWASGLGARGAACLDWACTEAREASHASLPSFLYLCIYTSIGNFFIPQARFKNYLLSLCSSVQKQCSQSSVGEVRLDIVQCGFRL